MNIASPSVPAESPPAVLDPAFARLARLAARSVGGEAGCIARIEQGVARVVASFGPAAGRPPLQDFVPRFEWGDVSAVGGQGGDGPSTLAVCFRSPSGTAEGFVLCTTDSDAGWDPEDIEALTDLAATASDVLGRRRENARREDALQVETSRLVTMIENLHSAILVEDDSRHIRYANQGFCTLFAVPVPPEAMIGADCSGAAEQSKGLFAAPEAFVRRVGELLEARAPERGELVRMADGRVLERDYIPIYVDGVYRGHLWAYEDVTEREGARQLLEEQARMLRELSLSDELTGLNNRRGFLTLARQQRLLAARSKGRAAIVFVDLDGMKEINDTHGHAAGDAALRATAGLLRETFRESDIVARLGGDEFVVFTVDADDAGVRVAANRLSQAVERWNEESAPQWSLALSIGVTTQAADDPEGLEGLLKRADDRMYTMKKSRLRSGRRAS